MRRAGVVIFVARCGLYAVLGVFLGLEGVTPFTTRGIVVWGCLLAVSACDAAEAVRQYRRGYAKGRAAGITTGYRAAMALVNWARFWRSQ